MLDDASPWNPPGTDKKTPPESPPYMVDDVLSPRRHYQPFIDKPALFKDFMNLNLDQDSFLKFADENGWIGHQEFVRSTNGDFFSAVGIDYWINEIQSMIVADRLLSLARNHDQHALSEYLFWHPDQFNIQVEIGIDGRRMRPLRTARRRPERVIWNGPLFDMFIDHEIIGRLPEYGWRKNDFTKPALGAAITLVNRRLHDLCFPALFLDREGRVTGHWTARNLLGCMWLQFHLKLIGQLKLRRCEVCKLEMDVTNSPSNLMMHLRCSRNRRQARWRKKKKAAVT